MSAMDSRPDTGHFFILGAPDPEMARIERVLAIGSRLGLVAGYGRALCQGDPVHPKTAYSATDVAGGVPPGTPMVLVECGFDSEPPGVFAHRIDHHSPGDPGFDRGPVEFWHGSSIGQVVEYLYRMNDPESEVNKDLAEALLPFAEDLFYAAAADHCLRDAYLGACPGIDPVRLEHWRAETRAFHQNVSPQQILSSFSQARAAVRAAQQDPVRCLRLAGKPMVRVEGSVSDLPDAACQMGVPVEYTHEHHKETGRCKVGILGADPDMIAAWMSERAPELGLEDVYGSPVRGYAGGYRALEA
ncbi:hypothetical protein [Thioalkalivibrio sp. ALE16]|uniref:hypothetical protein n=1 Tax=Thioalkalivibrio sp. ALE16 TaxID=1158172 RepID=UPI000368ED84|nr:hypothetical protein [Thioalkalivibrio sp. ALE16]